MKDRFGFWARSQRVPEAQKPYEFIGVGDIHGPKPYKFIGLGDIHGPKPYEAIVLDGVSLRFGGFVLGLYKRESYRDR